MVDKPNPETVAAFAEIQRGGLERFSDVVSLMASLSAPVLPHDAMEDSRGHVTVNMATAVNEETREQRLLRLCDEIHADNVKAGWWSDLATGEPLNRNRPEIMMLIVSELSEASEGCTEQVMDDKLPHLRMFDVELADTAIRLMDVLGADGVKSFGEDNGEWVQYLRYRSVDAALMLIVNHVSSALEHYRKGRQDHYVVRLADALLLTFDLAAAYHIDLFDVIAQKRAFNRVRADHKPENRRKDDGKKI